MNKVLVTGLGVGNSLGINQVCNLDYSWLIENPSTLIWTDKVLIMENSWRNREKTNAKQNKGINMVLDIAYDNGLIELVNLNSIRSYFVSQKVRKQVEADVNLLKETYPDVIKEGSPDVPGEIIVEDMGFCFPEIASIYGSQKLASIYNASCLMSDRDLKFLKYRFGMGSIPPNRSEVIDEIMSLYIPNELIFHNYAFTLEEKCDSCVHLNECKSTYLQDIEENTLNMLKWRDYDEIGRAKEELEKIIDIKNQSVGSYDIDDIKREYEEKQREINKKMKKVFPKVKRWANISTAFATAATIYNAFSGNQTATMISASFLGASMISEEYTKHYESKNAWVGFINKANNKRIY